MVKKVRAQMRIFINVTIIRSVFISVVVAVRNEVQYIEKCIQSLFSQNYKNFEVIVIDGISRDGTYQTLEKLQEVHDFILLRNEQQNAAAGRNRIGRCRKKGCVAPLGSPCS